MEKKTGIEFWSGNEGQPCQKMLGTRSYGLGTKCWLNMMRV